MTYAFLSLFQRIMDLIICQSVNIGQHVTVSSGGEENEICVNSAYFSVELLPVSLLLLLYLPDCDDLWDRSGEVVLHCFSYKYELKSSLCVYVRHKCQKSHLRSIAATAMTVSGTSIF